MTREWIVWAEPLSRPKKRLLLRDIDSAKLTYKLIYGHDPVLIGVHPMYLNTKIIQGENVVTPKGIGVAEVWMADEEPLPERKFEKIFEQINKEKKSKSMTKEKESKSMTEVTRRGQAPADLRTMATFEVKGRTDTKCEICGDTITKGELHIIGPGSKHRLHKNCYEVLMSK